MKTDAKHSPGQGAVGQLCFGGLTIVELHSQRADAIAERDALRAERDKLRAALDAIDKHTRNVACMSLQCNHEFERSPAAEAHRVALGRLLLLIRECASDALR